MLAGVWRLAVRAGGRGDLEREQQGWALLARKAPQGQSRVDLEGRREGGPRSPLLDGRPRDLQAPPFIVGCLQEIRERSGDVCAGLSGQLLRATWTVKVVEGIRVEGEWVTDQEPKEQEGRRNGAASGGIGSAPADGCSHGAQYNNPSPRCCQGTISASPPNGRQGLTTSRFWDGSHSGGLLPDGLYLSGQFGPRPPWELRRGARDTGAGGSSPPWPSGQSPAGPAPRAGLAGR